MKNNLLILLFCFVAASPVYAKNAYRSEMKHGLSQYAEGQYEVAKSHFGNAVQSASSNQLSQTAMAAYNLGAALYRTGQLAEAEQAYDQAQHSSDLEIQKRAHYNQGVALQKQGEAAAADETQLQQAVEHYDKALNRFENALLLDPSLDEAKTNYELSLARKEQLEELLQKQQEEQQQQQDQQNEDQENQEEEDDSQSEDHQNEEQDEQQQNDDSEEPNRDQEPENDSEENQQNSDDGENEEPPSPEQTQKGGEEPEPQELTKEEAEMLLNAMKDEEQANRNKAKIRLGKPVPVDKDW